MIEGLKKVILALALLFQYLWEKAMIGSEADEQLKPIDFTFNFKYIQDKL